MKPLPLNVVEKARDVHDASMKLKEAQQALADMYDQVQRVYNAAGRCAAEHSRRRARLRNALGLTLGCKMRWRDKSTGRWVYWKFYSGDVFDVDGVIKIKLYGCRANSRGHTNRPIPDKVLYEGEVFADGKWRPILP